MGGDGAVTTAIASGGANGGVLLKHQNVKHLTELVGPNNVI